MIKLDTLLNYLVISVVIAAACLCINVLAKSDIRPQAQIDYDQWGYTSGTPSMQPCINQNTRVYYRDNVTQLQAGRIYVYRNDAEDRVVHRLLYQADGWCYFKGDNNLYMDARVNCSQIELVVVGLEYTDIK
jgi:hypothetical protein